MQPDVIEYFYSAHSGFAYIGHMELLEVAKRTGRTLLHRPMHLGPVIQAVGGKTFHERTPEHISYFFGREVERWAAFRSVPIIDYRPTWHDEDMTLASCLLIAAQDLGLDPDRLAHLILQAHWRDDADIADEALLVSLATQSGADAGALLEHARSASVKAAYDRNTAEAIERSVFGSPTYFVDGDMYYGQDHLEIMEHEAKKG